MKRVFASRKMIYAVVLVFQLSVLNVVSQNSFSLHGKVTDENNTTLSGVKVELVEADLKTTTNNNGQFEFKNISYGFYTLILTNNNYNVVKQLHFKNVNDTFTIVLSKVEQLNEVTVTGSKKHKKKRLGYELHVIDLKSELNNSKTLNQVLEQSSSINVRQSGGLGSRTNYSINGLSDSSLRFFIDGIPMEYYGSAFSINTIPTSIIDKIEVYKGVTPINLSNDNLGGAINLITKKATDTTVEVSYSAGSFNTHISSIFTHLENKNNHGYLNAFAFYNYADNNYDIWGENVPVTNPETFETTRNNKVERFHDAFNSKSIKLSTGLKNKNWTDKLETGIIYADLGKELQHGTTMEVPFGKANYTQKNYTGYIEFKKRHLLRNKFGIQWYTGYADLTRKFIDTTKNIYSWNGQVIGQRTIGGELFGRLTLNTLKKRSIIQKTSVDYKITPEHTAYLTSLFAVIKREDNDPTIINKNEAYFSPQRFNKNTLGASLNSKWFKDKLTTSVFVKNHSFNADIKTTQDGQTFTNTTAKESLFGYGFSSAYKITQHVSVNTSLEKSNRLPEEEEVLGNGINILSTDKLNAEQSSNYNLGVEHFISLNDNSNLTYNITLFKRDVENLIKLWQQNDAVFVHINFDKVSITGIDVEADYKWKNKLQINYSISKLFPIIKSRFDENGNENLLFDTELPNTLLLKSTLNAQVNFTDTFQSNDSFAVKWTSNFTDSFFVRDAVFGIHNKDAILQQLSHSISVNYVFANKKITIGLDCNNIFNEQLFDNFALQKPSRAFFTKINWSII